MFQILKRQLKKPLRKFTNYNNGYQLFTVMRTYSSQLVQNIYGNNVGFLTSLSAFTLLSISEIICVIDGPFSPYTHWISNMGSDSSPSHLIFTSGFYITAFFLTLFVIALHIELWHNTNHSRIFWWIIPSGLSGFSTILGIFIFTKWDMFMDPLLHAVGACIFFCSSIISMLFITFALNYTHQGSIAQKWITFINGSLYLLSIPICLLSISLGLYPGISLAQLPPEAWYGLLSNMDPALGWCRILEWFLGYGFLIWLIQISFHLNQLKKQKQMP